MRNITIITLLLYATLTYSQTSDSLSLKDCYELAYKNYPLIKQKELVEKSSKYKIENYSKNYLPQFFLNAQSTYQSDVTQIELGIPNMHPPELSKDQYKISLEANQIIYDGGLIKNQKKLETFSSAVDNQTIEVEMYKINEKITQLFFNVLLLKENEAILKLAQKDIENKISKLESGIRNGTALEYNVLTLKAELLKLEQQLIELNSLRTGNLDMLSEFVGKPITDQSLLKLPLLKEIIDTNKIFRPEIMLFQYQKEKIEFSKKLISAKYRPKFNAFGQLGYGKPGLNMFLDDFDSYYIVGVKLNWNIWNWKQSTNEVKLLDIQSSMIDIQNEMLRKNIKTSCIKDLADIQKYEQLLLKDQQIVDLKKQILKSRSSQLDNGIITSADYLVDLNATLQAELNLQYHKLQLALTKSNIQNNVGVQK